MSGVLGPGLEICLPHPVSVDLPLCQGPITWDLSHYTWIQKDLLHELRDGPDNTSN